MQITLQPELEKFVRSQVASGRFKSNSAVVSAALETVRRKNGKPQVDKKIKAQIQEGIDAYERGEFTIHTAKDRKKLLHTIETDAMRPRKRKSSR